MTTIPIKIILINIGIGSIKYMQNPIAHAINTFMNCLSEKAPNSLNSTSNICCGNGCGSTNSVNKIYFQNI